MGNIKIYDRKAVEVTDENHPEGLRVVLKSGSMADPFLVITEEAGECGVSASIEQAKSKDLKMYFGEKTSEIIIKKLEKDG